MRAPVTLKIKFKSGNLDQFIERYSVDVSRGGIFIRTKEPLAVGTQLKFEFQLQDASSLISGDGTVVWIREHDPARTGVAPGMGVRFDKLPPQSQAVLDKILSEKTKRGDAQMESRFDAGVRASASASGTVSTPAASPAKAAAHSDFDSADSKHTPLPAPAPGLEGAGDEFGEESTRVMQDAVVQALADKTREEETNPFGAPEKTMRATQEQIDAQLKAAADVEDDAAEPAPAAPVEPTVEVAAEVIKSAPAPEIAMPAPSEAPLDVPRVAAPPRKRSALPAAFAAVLLLGGGGYIAMRVTGNGAEYKPPEPVAVKPAEPAPTPSAPANPAVAAPAPAAAGTPAAPPTKPSLSIPVTSDPPGALVSIDGTPLPEPTPTQLGGLDINKVYDVHMTLKGFHEWRVKLKPKAGEKLDAALVPNEKWVEVSSTPGGAEVLLDGKRVGKTPYTIHKLDVSKAHEVQVKHAGFLAQTRSISATDAFEPQGDKDVLAVALKLDPEPKAGSARAPVARKGAKKGDEKPSEPVAEKPPQAPVAEKPATAAVEKPVEEKPAVEKPAAEKPAAEKPAEEKPAAATEKAMKVPSWMKKQPSEAPAEGAPAPAPANP